MPPAHLLFTDTLVTRCAQVIYRCLEEVGSSKAALYLKTPGGADFQEICHFGWPRGARPPERVGEEDPLRMRIQREKRSFAVNDPASAPELAPFGGPGARFFVTPIYHMGDWIGILLQRDRLKGDYFDTEKDEAPALRICQELVDLFREFGLYGPPRPKAPAPIPTAKELVQQVPRVEHPAPRVVKDPAQLAPNTFPGAPDVIHMPQLKVGPQGQVAGEKLYGFENTAVGISSLPWETVDRTLSGLMSPLPPEPSEQRRRGIMTPELRAFFWEAGGLLSQILSAGAVALWMEDPEEIRPILCFSTLPLSHDLQQQVAAHAVYHLPGLRQHDLRIVSKVEMEESPGLSGAFATYLPLLMNEHGGAHDLLMVFRQEDQPFTLPEMEIIQRLGRIIGMQLEEARLHERYHQAYLSVSHRILKSAEGRLPHLRGHSVATARLARDLAIKLDLSSEDVESISIAAILHDVGMLMLDPAMVQKPRLTPEEKAQVRQHPDLAAIFLKDLRFPFDVIHIIRHHHERWDGRGYPERLQESAIPIGSRIIHVIEAYEVMTSGKGYRQPIGFRQALEELRKEAGHQFDPAVVEAFCELMTQKEGKA